MYLQSLAAIDKEAKEREMAEEEAARVSDEREAQVAKEKKKQAEEAAAALAREREVKLAK